LLLLIFYVAFALLVSFLCSILEATILSVSNSYIKGLVNEGRKSGLLLKKFKSDIDQPLAAILTLNTIANTLGATGAGAQAQKVFGNKWITLFAVCLTLAILFFSEIVPKTIGAVYWRKISPACSYILNFITILLYPFTILTSWVTGKLKPKDIPKLSMYRQEIEMLAEIGEDRGALTGWEQKVIKNILRLDKIKLREIMTPRTVVLSYQKDMTVGELLQKEKVLSFSRIPLYDEDHDDMIGMVLRPDILEKAAQDQDDITLESIMRPLHAVPESLSVAKSIELFIKRQEHIFLVIDEYGGTAGIVTMEDTMEALLGTEIVDETDTVEDMQKLALRLWKYRSKEAEKEDIKEEE